ncbi:MAG TPA: PIN domain-containing protein [Thermoanaerobaculia bacterium]|nr:PIN domain-containing protein [Thermoanaerobaculia bacterium]
MATLVDTSILLRRYDPRDRDKQALASRVLRMGLAQEILFLPHQAIVEFLAVATQPQADLPGGGPLLSRELAVREAEELMVELPVLHPCDEMLRLALRGLTYGLSWPDAHLLAYAEHYELDSILSEDFEHERFYGQVRVINPFMPIDTVHETRARYG